MHKKSKKKQQTILGKNYSLHRFSVFVFVFCEELRHELLSINHNLHKLLLNIHFTCLMWTLILRENQKIVLSVTLDCTYSVK